MAIRFLSGMPGHGKSYSSTKLMLKSLLEESGPNIVTNCAIRLGFMLSYLVKKGLTMQEAESRMARVKRITGPDVRKFFMLAEGRVATVDDVGNLEVSERGKPTDFYIDEAHLFWPVRDFRLTGPTLLSYLSQHRKFGDNVLFITQDEEQVDKALRRLTEEYLVSVNLGKRRVWGFRGPKGQFVMRVYFKQPNSLSKPSETFTYTFDKDVAECYDTSVGVGIASGMSDAGKKEKGLSPVFAVAAVLCLAVAVFFVIKTGPGMLTSGILSIAGAGGKKVAQTMGVTNDVPANVERRKTQATNTVEVKAATPGGIGFYQPQQQPESLQPTVPVTAYQPQVPPFQPELAPRGVLANPDASPVGTRWVVIRGFDGKVHAVRRIQAEPELSVEALSALLSLMNEYPPPPSSPPQ